MSTSILACPPGSLLDHGPAGSPRPPAPTSLPPLRSGARDDAPPSPRLPFLVASMARGPGLAAAHLQPAGQRRLPQHLVAIGKTTHPQADAQGTRIHHPACPLDAVEAPQ